MQNHFLKFRGLAMAVTNQQQAAPRNHCFNEPNLYNDATQGHIGEPSSPRRVFLKVVDSF